MQAQQHIVLSGMYEWLQKGKPGRESILRNLWRVMGIRDSDIFKHKNQGNTYKWKTDKDNVGVKYFWEFWKSFKRAR